MSTVASPTPVVGISHVAVNTADLDRFRRFYEGVLGVPLGVVMRLEQPPHLRHALFHVAPGLALHVFEVPGYDPVAQGIGVHIGERGRVDHFGLSVGDEATLRAVADRLRAAGASDGEVRSLGSTLSVHVTDPDGLQLEVDCPNPAFDAASFDEVEEVVLADWAERLVAPVRSGVPS